MERREACTLLGVPEDVDLATLKRRFRTLARDHHPDRGGDPVVFLELRRAFALLRAELDGDAPSSLPPLVARGHPSRATSSDVLPREVDAARLDDAARRLADRLGREGSSRYASRAPGARTNRLAGSLAAASTSSLLITVAATSGADVELTARTRAARRAVTALDVTRLHHADWARRRGDAITVLRARLQQRPEAGPTMADLTVAAVVELLDALAWPLREWTVDTTAR